MAATPNSSFALGKTRTGLPFDPVSPEKGTQSSSHTSCSGLIDRGLRQEAATYHLATVKFPIDYVDPYWDDGRNRSVNHSHRERLCKLFETNLDRTNPAHWLRLMCRKEDVELMKHHLHRLTGRRDSSQSWLDFMDWGEVVRRPVVLLAGHHRVQALQQLLQEQEEGNSSAGDRWWICDIYDQAICSPGLRIRLRANQEDVLLPDSHSQVWNEMVTLAHHVPQLFTGKAKEVEQRISRELGFNGHDKFPVGRLGTLWRNDQWRSVITKLCEFSLGQNLFSISTFEWFSSRRLNDLWFVPLRQLIRVLDTVRQQCAVEFILADWTKLVDLCPQDVVSSADLTTAFFPPQQRQEKTKGKKHAQHRHKGLFTSLDDKKYHRVYTTLSSVENLHFPDVVGWLKISKHEGQLISTVMTHVGQWLHAQPYEVQDRNSSKPPLRLDLVPALQHNHGTQADAASITLQRDIAMIVCRNASSFSSSTVKHWLEEFPRDHPETYRKRFQDTASLNVLQTVHQMVGSHFQGAAMRHYNQHGPSSISSHDIDVLPSVISQALANLPSLQQHPTLGTPDTLEDLHGRLQPVILQWLQDHSPRATDPLPSLNAVQVGTVLMSTVDVSRREELEVQSLSPRSAGIDITVFRSEMSNGSFPDPRSALASAPLTSVPPFSSSPGFEDIPRPRNTTRQPDHYSEEIFAPKSVRTGQSRSSSVAAASARPEASWTDPTPPQTRLPGPSDENPKLSSGSGQPKCSPAAPVDPPPPARQSVPSSLVPAKRKCLSSGSRTWRATPGIARRQ